MAHNCVVQSLFLSGPAVLSCPDLWVALRVRFAECFGPRWNACVGIPVVSLGVATGTGEAWGSTGSGMPFGSASVTALGVVKWVPMSRLARTHL